jgi:hypothetical protein
MAKSSPEKLAAALRANIKRRKQAAAGALGLDKVRAPEPASQPPRRNSSPKPPKNSA